MKNSLLLSRNVHITKYDAWQTRTEVDQIRKSALHETHIATANAVEDEEDVVERDGADEVEEEPCADVVARDQPWVDDHLFAVVLLHYA